MEDETGAHSSSGYGLNLRHVVAHGLLWGWLMLTGCTHISVIQVTPRKDLNHPVPAPRGWTFQANQRG